MATRDTGASPLKKGKSKHRRGRKHEMAQDDSASGICPAQGQSPVRDLGQVPKNTDRESSCDPPTKRLKRRSHRESEAEQAAPPGPAQDLSGAMEEGSTPSTLPSAESLGSNTADAKRPKKQKRSRHRESEAKQDAPSGPARDHSGASKEGRTPSPLPSAESLGSNTADAEGRKKPKKQKRSRHRESEAKQDAPSGPARDHSGASKEGRTPSPLPSAESLGSNTADAEGRKKPKKQKRSRHRESEAKQDAPSGPARDHSGASKEGRTPSPLPSAESLGSNTADAKGRKKPKKQKRSRLCESEAKQDAPSGPARDHSGASKEGRTPSPLPSAESLGSNTADAKGRKKPKKQKRSRQRESEAKQDAPSGPARDHSGASKEGRTPSPLPSAESLGSNTADAKGRKKQQKRGRHRESEAAPSGPAQDHSGAMKEGRTPSPLPSAESLVSNTADALKQDKVNPKHVKVRKPSRKREHQSLVAPFATHTREPVEVPSVEMVQAQDQSKPWPENLYMERESAGLAPFSWGDLDSPAPHKASKKKQKQKRRRRTTSPDTNTLASAVPPVEDVASGGEAHRTQGTAQSPVQQAATSGEVLSPVVSQSGALATGYAESTSVQGSAQASNRTRISESLVPDIERMIVPLQASLAAERKVLEDLQACAKKQRRLVKVQSSIADPSIVVSARGNLAALETRIARCLRSISGLEASIETQRACTGSVSGSDKPDPTDSHSRETPGSGTRRVDRDAGVSALGSPEVAGTLGIGDQAFDDAVPRNIISETWQSAPNPDVGASLPSSMPAKRKRDRRPASKAKRSSTVVESGGIVPPAESGEIVPPAEAPKSKTKSKAKRRSYLDEQLEEQRLLMQRAGTYASSSVEAPDIDNDDSDYAPDAPDSDHADSGEGTGLASVPPPDEAVKIKKDRATGEPCPISTCPVQIGWGHMARHLRSRAHMLTDSEAKRVMQQYRNQEGAQSYRSLPCPLQGEIRLSDSAGGKPCMTESTTRLGQHLTKEHRVVKDSTRYQALLLQARNLADQDGQDETDDENVIEEDPNTRFERIVTAFSDSKESRHSGNQLSPDTSKYHRSALKLFLPDITGHALRTLVHIGDKGGRIDSLIKPAGSYEPKTIRAYVSSLGIFMEWLAGGHKVAQQTRTDADFGVDDCISLQKSLKNFGKTLNADILRRQVQLGAVSKPQQTHPEPWMTEGYHHSKTLNRALQLSRQARSRQLTLSERTLVRNALYLGLMLDQISRAGDINCIKQTQALDIVNQWVADGCPKTKDYSLKVAGAKNAKFGTERTLTIHHSYFELFRNYTQYVRAQFESPASEFNNWIVTNRGTDLGKDGKMTASAITKAYREPWNRFKAELPDDVQKKMPDQLYSSGNRGMNISMHREGGASRTDQVGLAKVMGHGVEIGDTTYYKASDIVERTSREVTGKLREQRRMQTKLTSPLLGESDSDHADSAVSDYEGGFDHDFEDPALPADSDSNVVVQRSESQSPMVSPMTVLSLGTVPPARTVSAMGTADLEGSTDPIPAAESVSTKETDMTTQERNEDAKRWLSQQGDAYVKDFVASVFEKPLIACLKTEQSKKKLTEKKTKACSLGVSEIAQILQDCVHPLASRFREAYRFRTHYLKEALRVRIKWMSEQFIRKYKLNDLNAYERFVLDHDNMDFF